MVALQDEEREEEPLHLVAPDMGGTTERGPLDKAPAPAPATLEAASVEEDEVEEDDVDGGGEDQDGEAVDDAEGLDDDLEDVCLDCFDTRNDFEPDFMTLLASCIFARSKQFVYPVLGVGVLAQPPGEVVEGVVEAAGVVALPAERWAERWAERRAGAGAAAGRGGGGGAAMRGWWRRTWRAPPRGAHCRRRGMTTAGEGRGRTGSSRAQSTSCSCNVRLLS